MKRVLDLGLRALALLICIAIINTKRVSNIQQYGVQNEIRPCSGAS